MIATKFRLSFLYLICATMVVTVGVSCAPVQSEHISLAAFTENNVDVSIFLEPKSEGKYILSATFTPPEGYHLYSKDIPLTGIDGVGRPTLIELTPTSHLNAVGELIESVKAREPDFEPKALLIYPSGPVTLSLPVELPTGSGWTEDEIQITYMACSVSQCKLPVVAKRVLIAVPGAAMFDRK